MFIFDLHYRKIDIKKKMYFLIDDYLIDLKSNSIN
jgi:hypothetical protein